MRFALRFTSSRRGAQLPSSLCGAVYVNLTRGEGGYTPIAAEANEVPLSGRLDGVGNRILVGDGFFLERHRVPFPYVEVFLALLVAYMGYSIWAGLDARYLIAAALVLLVATAVVNALGNSVTANTLAEYVFFFLGAGVVLLLIEHVRKSRRTPGSPPGSAGGPQRESSEAPEKGQGAPGHSFDRLEEQSITVVDASSDEDEYDE